MLNDYGYIDKAIANIREVAEKQEANIKAAAKLMADAIAADKLINVYAGGGHTTLAMGEMFFRAGGLANINPLMETALSVFNQALKYLELERTVNFGASIIKYYGIKEGDVVIFFHNIGINPATIDAAEECKKRGAKIIAVASSYWQNEMPKDHFIRHPNGKNLFDYADVCIDDYNPDRARHDHAHRPRLERGGLHHRAPPRNRDVPPVRGARHRAARVELGERPRRRREERRLPREVQAAREVSVVPVATMGSGFSEAAYQVKEEDKR